GTVSDELPLVAFGVADQSAATERDRAEGIALARLASDIPPELVADQRRILRLARTRLEGSIRKWPRDVPALEALAEGYELQERPEQAFVTIQKVLTVAPWREQTLALAVKVAMQTGDTASAEICADKIVTASPTSFRHRMRRGLVRMELRDFAGAEADFRA